MKKKFVAMLLVLATLLTLMPVTAMAAPSCSHNESWYYKYRSNGDYTHDYYCTQCQNVKKDNEACTASSSFWGSSDTCQHCKGPVCTHQTSSTSNNNGTHTTKCACGQVSKTENCTYYYGDTCYICRGGRPCDHSLTVHTSNKNNTHNSACACGQNKSNSVACTFGTNGRCTVCKDKRYCDHTLNDFAPDGKGNHSKSCDCGLEKTDPVKCTYGEDDLCTVCKGKNPCNHVADNITNNGDGTHSTTCDCGKVATDNTPCTFDAEGVCTICKGACPHTNTTLKSNGIHDHSNICDDCNVVLSTNRHYYNFFTHLCNCGDADPFFQKICPHEEYEVININNASMHEVACRLCHLMRYYEPHGYNANGVCACGHSKGACTHTNIGHVSKGTENETICKDCGKVFESEELKCEHIHEYNIFDICIHCGAVNPNDIDPNPIKPDDEPTATYPADAWKDLDKHFTTHK